MSGRDSFIPIAPQHFRQHGPTPDGGNDSEVNSQLSLAWGKNMLWTIFAILLILWLLGWGFHVAGSLIHILLVIAVIVLVINLVTGRRTV